MSSFLCFSVLPEEGRLCGGQNVICGNAKEFGYFWRIESCASLLKAKKEIVHCHVCCISVFCHLSQVPLASWAPMRSYGKSTPPLRLTEHIYLLLSALCCTYKIFTVHDCAQRSTALLVCWFKCNEIVLDTCLSSKLMRNFPPRCVCVTPCGCCDICVSYGRVAYHFSFWESNSSGR